jgi:nucleoside-diphosphate-sugar epimerase
MTLVLRRRAPEKPPRAVVLGAAGFIGGAVAARLEMQGVCVLRLARRDVDLVHEHAADTLAGLLRPDDTLVAAAAVAPVRDMGGFVANARLVRTTAEALKRRPVAHVVNIGSDAIYADSPAPLDEASPTAPDSLHGAMHLFREIALRGAADTFCSLRPTLVYGAGDPHDGYGPNRFRRLAQRGADIELFGDGEERRDHVHVDDVAELAVRLVLHGATGILNAATGTVASFRDIAERVVSLAGANVAIRTRPRAGPMPHGGYRAFDPARAKAAFPDFRFTALADGLARVQAETAGQS